jgi:hypothetical protein
MIERLKLEEIIKNEKPQTELNLIIDDGTVYIRGRDKEWDIVQYVKDSKEFTHNNFSVQRWNETCYSVSLLDKGEVCTPIKENFILTSLDYRYGEYSFYLFEESGKYILYVQPRDARGWRFILNDYIIDENTEYEDVGFRREYQNIPIRPSELKIVMIEISEER